MARRAASVIAVAFLYFYAFRVHTMRTKRIYIHCRCSEQVALSSVGSVVVADSNLEGECGFACIAPSDRVAIGAEVVRHVVKERHIAVRVHDRVVLALERAGPRPRGGGWGVQVREVSERLHVIVRIRLFAENTRDMPLVRSREANMKWIGA